MIYAVPTMLASAIAFTAPAHPARNAIMRPVVVQMPALQMLAANSGRRAQLAALTTGMAGLVGASTAVSAAEPRSTPWSFSTFLDAVERYAPNPLTSDGRVPSSPLFPPHRVCVPSTPLPLLLAAT